MLWVGDIGTLRALKSVRVNPDNERSTIEINVNININGTNGKSPASGYCFTPEFKYIKFIFRWLFYIYEF